MLYFLESAETVCVTSTGSGQAQKREPAKGIDLKDELSVTTPTLEKRDFSRVMADTEMPTWQVSV